MRKRTAQRRAVKGWGAHAQAIGSGRAGRNTQVHAITDPYGRPLAFHLTPGQAADCRAAEHLLAKLPERCIVHADRAYDTNRVRELIESHGAVPNIPPKRTRLWKSCFSKILYKGRNSIERMFWRLKGLQTARNPLRPDRHQLPRRHRSRRRHHVVVVSPSPRRNRSS